MLKSPQEGGRQACLLQEGHGVGERVLPACPGAVLSAAARGMERREESWEEKHPPPGTTWGEGCNSCQSPGMPNSSFLLWNTPIH